MDLSVLKSFNAPDDYIDYSNPEQKQELVKISHELNKVIRYSAQLGADIDSLAQRIEGIELSIKEELDACLTYWDKVKKNNSLSGKREEVRILQVTKENLQKQKSSADEIRAEAKAKLELIIKHFLLLGKGV